MMRNEGARMEIMIAARFALVVFQQAQIAHLNTRLINVLENQVAATALERNTAMRQQGAPGPPIHHFYQEHDGIARSAPRAPTRNLHDRHFTGPCELTLPRPAARIWLQPGMEPKHDRHQHGAAIIAVILALAIAMFMPTMNSCAAYSNARPEHQTVPNQNSSQKMQHRNPDGRKRSRSQHPRARVNGQRAPRTNC